MVPVWEWGDEESKLILTSFSQKISEVSEALEILQAIIFSLQMGKPRLRTRQEPLLGS